MPPSTILPARRPPSMGGPIAADVTLGRFAELITQGIGTGQYQFEPYLDRQTEETYEIKQAYRRMLRHPVVKAALLGKINAVSSLDLTMTPAGDQQRDKDIADFTRAAYTSEIEGGLLGIAEEILLPGLMDGTSVTHRVWNDEVKDRGKWRGKRFWRKFKAKEHARLKVDEFRNVTAVCSTFGRNGNEELPPKEFVIFRNLQLFQGPGMSDLRAPYAPWWRLTTLEKLRVIYLDKFASGGMVLGTYDNEDDRPKLVEAATAATARSWAVIPSTVKLELLRLASGAEAEFKSAIDSHKEDIALAISGAFLQMLTSGNQNPRGSSAVQKSTAELFVWALSAKFCELLNKQATPYLVDENFIDADYPTAALGGVNYGEMNSLAALYKQAVDMGAKPSRKAFAQSCGIQLATDPADELLPPSQPAPGGGGPGGAPFFGQAAEESQRYARQFADDGHDFCGGKGGKPGPCPTGSSGRQQRIAGSLARAKDKASKPTVADIKAKILGGGHDPTELAGQMAKMSRKELVGLKSELGVKASGNKAALAKKIAERSIAKAKASPNAKTPAADAPKPAPATSKTKLNPEQVTALHKDLGSKMPDLSDDQTELVGDYTSGAYQEINGALREGRPPTKGAKVIPALDKAIADAPTLAEPVTVYRGLRLDNEKGQQFLASAQEAAKTGGVLRDPAFASTTIDSGIATTWATGGSGAQVPIVMEISARKGLYIGASVGGTKEKEFIMGRNTGLRVLRVEDRGTHKAIIMEQE